MDVVDRVTFVESSHFLDKMHPNTPMTRLLQDEEEAEQPFVLWQAIYTSLVLVLMFAALISERIGADHVMITALAAYLVAGVIDLTEALVGFSNKGLLTVLLLFVVADGISKTGAMDYYLGRLLGRPKTQTDAQIRLMIPVAILSAFLNNTPIVAVMIPIVQKWAKSINMPIQQLLIPLSFATILGGTCTLIGTSTNLVVIGLLQENFGDQVTIGLFDLGTYGVPVAFAGLAYILLAAPFLLPGAQGKESVMDDSDALMGARLAPWSPAVGRSVQRSGLRDNGGIYLVSVLRASTGHIHRAVSGDFVLSAGDVLYFTGLAESFGDFCEEHGLEVVTNELDVSMAKSEAEGLVTNMASLLPTEVGLTKSSLLKSDEGERLRQLAVMSDLIHGYQPASPRGVFASADPDQIVVTIEKDLIVVGINTQDRPGLMLDISRTLVRLDLEVRHTEAAVVGDRSISIWRCDLGEEAVPHVDLDEIWTVLSALLSKQAGAVAMKKRGQRVVRARVTKGSKLSNQKVGSVDFRSLYKAAIIAVQKPGVESTALSKVELKEGDVLVLQVTDDSALLVKPPADFYSTTKDNSQSSTMSMLVGKLRRSTKTEAVSSETTDAAAEVAAADVELAGSDLDVISKEDVWRDLQVLFRDGEGNGVEKEFLTAMQIAPRAKLIGKNVQQVGIQRLPSLVLVGIERPDMDESMEDTTSRATDRMTFSAVNIEEPLQAGDVLWFSGPASAVGDLRKIPGLVSYESEEVEKMKEKVQDRRLVEAVIARSGPLVGKTVREVQFRTRYGAAVIAIHREGKRVHEHPGNVVLHAGDVLLLEAGPSFVAKSANTDPSFALLAEVKDSAPPRLWLLIPAILIVIAMLTVYMTGVTTLLESALVAAIVMVALGILSEQEARDAINWEIYITIAAAFGIGTAMVNSGVAGGIANFMVGIGTAMGIGDAGILGAVYFATFLISNVVTNNAAAALIFPIAMDAAVKTGTDLALMSFALMLGASASFMTPYGYTTNLLIYGPGGYKYTDFLWIGTPMQIVLWILSTAVLAVVRPWYISWLVTGGFLVLVIIARVGNASLAKIFGAKGLKAKPTAVTA